MSDRWAGRRWPVPSAPHPRSAGSSTVDRHSCTATAPKSPARLDEVVRTLYRLRQLATLQSTVRLLDVVKLSVEVCQFLCQATHLACDLCASLLKQRAALFAAYVVVLIGRHGGRSPAVWLCSCRHPGSV